MGFEFWVSDMVQGGYKAEPALPPTFLRLVYGSHKQEP